MQQPVMIHAKNLINSHLFCPSCGAHGKYFPAFKILNRVVKKKCSSCGVEIESEMRGVKYLLLLIYVQVIFTLVAIPLVLGMVAEKWGVAIASAVIFIILVFPLAMMLHARNAVARNHNKTY